MSRHFWAKTHPEVPSRFKSVPHHCADVAATTLVLCQTNPTRLARDAALTGLAPQVHARACAFIAGLHDIGKFSKGFQGKQQQLWPSAVLGPYAPCGDSLGHWQASASILLTDSVRHLVEAVLGDLLSGPMIAAIAGHHGMAPPSGTMDSTALSAEKHGEVGRECVGVAKDFIREWTHLFPDLRGLGEAMERESFSFSFNGLLTLADWIGSDAAYFGFEDPDLPLCAYWPLALERAQRAVRDKGLLPPRLLPAPTLARFTPHGAMPRSMQVAVQQLAIPAEPQIVVIEDGTGSGKTEAALLLAARMMEQRLGEGVFFAMPTMATANAMYDRLKLAVDGLFEDKATLVLAHGKREVAQALDRLKRSGPDLEATTVEDEVGQWCDAWIADSRKTALFASVGAGTIDQAFLSILRKKHLTLRQHALAGRILVIDEAHCFDAYMGEELKTLVEMQARLGGSVIILSATLTQTKRKELVAAFAVGRGRSGPKLSQILEAEQPSHYPLLTQWGPSAGQVSILVKSDADRMRRVAVRRIASRADVVAGALAAAGAGAAVAIVCNAVDSAIEVFDSLLKANADRVRTHLFHARFTVDDRLAIEGDVQTWFGRDSDPATRAGRILVATQVIEQSLDVDFDVLFTDLAPVDLIVQRAGRLWRHTRAERPVAEPVVHLLTPEPGETVPVKWLEPVLGPAAFTYAAPAIMWRTALDLCTKGVIETPGDLRRLIESAYRDGTEGLPPDFDKAQIRATGQELGQTTVAKSAVIRPGDSYAVLSELRSEDHIGTRLGEPTETLRLVRRVGGVLLPITRRPGASDRLNWALSEVTVRQRWLQDAKPRPDDAALRALRAGWPDWERETPVVEVQADGLVLMTGPLRFRYDRQRGFQRIAEAQGGPD